jgi:predicted MFS family arabinose efflux permease
MDTETPGAKPPLIFSGYQKFVIGVLAFLQFTIILDFMIISPLGAMMMPTLHINPQQFGWAVSSYAFSAGVSGVLAAGFADRFDRKRLLLFFYCGFMLGTLLCALANNFAMLLMARILTGLFGGVIGSCRAGAGRMRSCLMRCGSISIRISACRRRRATA